MIEESTNFKFIQDESTDIIVDPVIEESNHMAESYTEVRQDIDISCRDLVIHEDEQLTDFDVALKIKEIILVKVILIMPWWSTKFLVY